MKNPVTVLAVVVGLILLVVAVIYFTTPASSLPSFFPGYDPANSGTHLKHAFAATFLALASFALAWFKSGKSSASPKVER